MHGIGPIAVVVVVLLVLVVVHPVVLAEEVVLLGLARGVTGAFRLSYILTPTARPLPDRGNLQPYAVALIIISIL